jgi:hypothetical protein
VKCEPHNAIAPETRYLFYERNVKVSSVHWKDSGNTKVINLKNGETETYDLLNAKETKKFKEKYGIPPGPPPPPPSQKKVS